MTSMTVTPPPLQPMYGGVDTHKDTHHAAVVDTDGHRIADREFATGQHGDDQMCAWLTQWPIEAIAVEQTGTYGAGLTRSLHAEGYRVKELNHPDPTVRACAGKSDPIDAYSAAQAARTGRASITPKDRTGIIESIRMIKAARASAIKARTAAVNQIRDFTIIAPQIRDKLTGMTTTGMMAVIITWRPHRDHLDDPVQAAKLVLRQVAIRVRELDAEITAYTRHLDTLTAQIAPRLRALPQVGTLSAAQLLITVGQCPTRIKTDAQFARLCGIAPIPASSGKTHRTRLHRGGDRQANCAIHLVTIGRLNRHEKTIAYRDRRTAENLSTKDIIRAVKRYVARELFYALKADLTAWDTNQNNHAHTT
ncbi:IS110 family transposase [Gordonia sp. w5E2]|nr:MULTISPECIES: IS110 family transposase [Gordonia]OBA36384.1 transposase [Gordonia sp. 852002-51296_SCH5728562-b]OBA72767.1 transposase [Gordonia sp. 852002-10350_SCH5691597]